MATTDKTPATATPAAKTTPKRDGPSPAHLLLNSIARAVDVGVEPAKLVAALDFARAASGASQAPTWRTVATMLDGYADAIKPAGKPAE